MGLTAVKDEGERMGNTAIHKNDARCQSSAVRPTLLESVELIVEVLDDVLPLGRSKFFLGHVGPNGSEGGPARGYRPLAINE